MKDKSHRTSKKGVIREYIEAIVVAVLIALCLRAFVIEAFKIPTGSMIPTLKIGDHIFVNKFVYGLRIPYTKIRFFDFKTPKRGEVIVFIFPLDNSKDYIKRVVGLPGDTIELKEGLLFVNETPVTQTAAQDLTLLNDLPDGDKFNLFTEKTGEAEHYTQYFKYEDPQNYGPRTVPPGKLFVMGDNRNRSYDSRGWGFVPLSNVKGRALFVWLSLDTENRVPLIGLPRIRWERFGKMIH